jgi:hypothetical protein
MSSLLSRLNRFNPFAFAAANTAPPAGSVAQVLMERAEAESGRTPYEAEQLRRAARAWLSVVR